MDDRTMWERSLANDLAAVKANPKDNFAWFNVGTDYVGARQFRGGGHRVRHGAAAQAAVAHAVVPVRPLPGLLSRWAGTRRSSRLADATIRTAKNDEELFYWKGLAQHALGDILRERGSLRGAEPAPDLPEAVDALATVQ